MKQLTHSAYLKWYSETCVYIQILQLWRLRLHSDHLHKTGLLGQPHHTWFHWSLIRVQACFRQAAIHKDTNANERRTWYVKSWSRGPQLPCDTCSIWEHRQQKMIWTNPNVNVERWTCCTLKIWRQIPTTGPFLCQTNGTAFYSSLNWAILKNNNKTHQLLLQQ